MTSDISSRQHKELTLEQKLQVIQYLENHSQRSAAKFFGVSKTSVNSINKRKNEYLKRSKTENVDLKRKVRKTEFEEINNAVMGWLNEMRTNSVRPTGPMMQKVALDFAKQFGITNFNASSGWLDSFKKRYDISFRKMNEEVNVGMHFCAIGTDFCDETNLNSDEISNLAVEEKLNEASITDESFENGLSEIVDSVLNEEREIDKSDENQDREIAEISKINNLVKFCVNKNSLSNENDNGLSLEINGSFKMADCEVAEMLCKLKSFALKHCPKMLHGIISAETSFNSYLIEKNKCSA